jgi:S1-C subfamily serine protease
MRRPALYSSTTRAVESAETVEAAASLPATSRRARWRAAFSPSSPRVLWGAILVLAALLVLSLSLSLRQGARKLTQEDINAAVLKTLETNTLPSPAAKAYEAIRPSVVRVVGYVKKSSLKEKDAKPAKPESKPTAKSTAPASPTAPGAQAAKEDDEEVENGVGTGVVIVDKGIILTNLHVVQGAQRIMVTFSDGLEASASVVSVQPENDLAVLQAHKIPDDMIAATMRSTADLAPGDQVVAVGFPFGIGPSASAGIVSGLKRAFRSPQGKQEMTNLIQFDAAANPGNSGGPLVTMDGEVVGIVTAILNPTSARTFIGIGFAVPIENAASAAGLPPF